MARNRKLGNPTDQRLAMASCFNHRCYPSWKILTTETRAKEVKAIVDSLVALCNQRKG